MADSDELKRRIDGDLQDLTLLSVVDGNLEGQFQERLQEGLECLAGHPRLEGKNGAFTVTIPLEVSITFIPGDQAWEVAARALQCKKPKPIASARPAYKREMGLKVRPEEQIDWTSQKARNTPEHGTA